MCKKVIIIGAGGHAKVIADIVLKSNDEVIGFLDDNVEIGTVIIKENRLKVIGKINNCYKFQDEYNAEFIIAIGDNKIRAEIAQKYDLKYYTAIHSTAVIGSDVRINEGTVIMPNTCINCSAQVGKHCIINTAAVVEHDNNIMDFVHISPNVALAGTVTVGKYVHIGVGAIVRNNISICDNVIVGAGAVVVKNIDEVGLYIGIPATKK